MTVKEQKKHLRLALREKIAGIPKEAAEESDRALLQFVLASEEFRLAKSVFAFVGTSREINTKELLLETLRRGKTLCVPLCTGVGTMEARKITSLSELSPGAYGILEPMNTAPVLSKTEIDLAVLPCLAATRTGKRLGQGGGYYDRFLADYTGSTLLLCRECSMLNDLPTEEHDLILPAVVTERGIFRTDFEVPKNANSGRSRHPDV